MTPELQVCVEMLERFRDTYLKNNAQEKININQAIEKARATDRKVAEVDEPKPKAKKRSK